MSRQGTIKCYTLIMKKVQEDYFPTLSAISSYLEDKGFSVTLRSLQRYFEQLDAEFGVKISYCRQKKGYYISETDKILFEPFLKFLEQFHTAEIIIESLAHSRETLNCIAFDTNRNFKGLDFLAPLLQALREKLQVSFAYQTFFEGPTRNCAVYPYLLKEYLGRWYLVASFNNGEKLYIFGLDRMSDLKISKQTFVPDTRQDARQKFQDTIGVSSTYESREKIVLSFTPQQGNYIKSLPLHNSQKILTDNDQECRIELSIIPNFELTQKILMHGPTVKVLEPAWLRAEIKAQLQETLQLY